MTMNTRETTTGRRRGEARNGSRRAARWLSRTAAGGFALAVTLIAPIGCAENTGVNPGYLDPSLPYPRIMIADDVLAAGLRYDEPIVVRDEDGFIRRVEVTVRAAAQERLTVDYRPLFKDANGTVIQPESSWRTTFLEQRVPERIVMLPVARNAVDYEIQFRWSK